MSIVYPRPGSQKTIYVGGFDETVDEAKLYNAFIVFGDIKEVFIPRDKTVAGAHRGFGFVEYESAEDAKSAIDNMHMNLVFGQIIRCNLARPTRITTAGIHTAPIWEMEAAAGVEGDALEPDRQELESGPDETQI